MSEHVFNVNLQYPAPWGFRLAGGIDFAQPLSISRVSLSTAVFGIYFDRVLRLNSGWVSVNVHLAGTYRDQLTGCRSCYNGKALSRQSARW